MSPLSSQKSRAQLVWKIDGVSLAKHLGLSEDPDSSPSAAMLSLLDKTHFVFMSFRIINLDS